MTRRIGTLSLALALAAVLLGLVLGGQPGLVGPILDSPSQLLLSKVLFAVSLLLGIYGLYVILLGAFADRTESKRRRHDFRNVLRLLFGAIGLIGLFGLITEQWVGVLFSLGVVGFAITFALQQPLFSLIGWVYIMVKRPYSVGDRVAIDEARGDVVSVDFFVTTLWEIDGPLISSNQPSGRIITVPNSVVLSSYVYNFSWQEFPYVWNDLGIQVAYETDLAFASEVLQSAADEYLGDEMAARIDGYRKQLAETPVELELQDRPSVNISQKESWVELRLRYLVHPKRGQRVKNELYRRILERFNEHPERIKFPVGRPR